MQFFLNLLATTIFLIPAITASSCIDPLSIQDHRLVAPSYAALLQSSQNTKDTLKAESGKWHVLATNSASIKGLTSCSSVSFSPCNTARESCLIMTQNTNLKLAFGFTIAHTISSTSMHYSATKGIFSPSSSEYEQEETIVLYSEQNGSYEPSFLILYTPSSDCSSTGIVHILSSISLPNADSRIDGLVIKAAGLLGSGMGDLEFNHDDATCH